MSRYDTELPNVSAAELSAWHDRPGASERLQPPWQRLRWMRTPTLEPTNPGEGSRDDSTGGCFSRWQHTHAFSDTPQGARLVDEIDWALVGAPLSVGAHPFTRAHLDKVFAHRHTITREDLEVHRGVRPRTIGITGASGLVGRALTAFLRTAGHVVVPFVRRQAGAGEIRWDVAQSRLDSADLTGLDVVIHLAGEPIAGRWSPAKKRRIHDSRVEGTRLLSEAMARAVDGPRHLVSASAVGVYGHRTESVDEDSRLGTGFLAEVGKAWEAAAAPARAAGIRVVHPRIGIVLSARGGALASMLPAFRWGLGGPLGDGRQHIPWIALDDLVDVLYRLAIDDSLEGPINAVGPNPVPQRAFASALGRALMRPTVLPAPAAALRLLGGEASALLLDGAPVQPQRLNELGHPWRRPELDAALAWELGV